MSAAAKWLPSVGLEIHAQVLSRNKLLSNGRTLIQGKRPNTAVDLFDIALPGTMPVVNVNCVKAGVLTALAVGAQINIVSFFDRKHYFYPDLPAGYQITQKRVPLAIGGSLTIPFQNRQQILKVRFKQLQLEQDSGKITYGEPFINGGKETLIDYNRTGVALIEMVTEPDLTNGMEAAAFVKELRQILLAIGTCDGNIQDGSMRVDANVSVRSASSVTLGDRTEIKNVSGFKLLSKAIDYEISRQITVLENGGEIQQETRRIDERSGVTIATRSKTKLQDYCFMAEHDLPPIVLNSSSSEISSSDNESINIDQLLHSMPELPSQLRARLSSKYSLSTEQVQVLMGRDNASCYFERVIQHCSKLVPIHLVHSWITSELYGVLDNMNIELKDSPVSSEQLASIVTEVTNGSLPRLKAKKILTLMANGDRRLAHSIASSGVQVALTHEELLMACIKVLQLYPEKVTDYLSGKEKVLGFFVGQVMKETERNGDPKIVKLTLKTELDKLQTPR